MTQDTSQTKEKGYKKLLAWQKADELAYQIYFETKKFPRYEIFGITSQIRRAALSVPTNIVEAMGRQSKGEMKQFLNIGLGSLAETEYLIEFSKRLKYIDEKTFNKLEGLRREVGALLWGLYKSF